MQDRGDRLFDELGLAFLDDENGALADAEVSDFVIDQRIGDVHDVERDGCFAVNIREAEALQRAHHTVVDATEEDQTDIPLCRSECLVELVALDEIDRCRPASLQLLLLVRVGRWWQHDAVDVALGVLEGIARCESRADIVLAGEAAVHVAGANAYLQHDRRVRGFRQGESVFHCLDDGRQIWPRIDQPHLRLHREGVAALLHDGGAFAVVLAKHDQCAAGHATGREIGERVGGDIGTGRRFPRHRATQWVHDGSRQHGGRARLGG